MATLDHHVLRHRHPGVAFRLAEDREGETAGVSEHSPTLAQGPARLGHQHVAEAADHAVDARVVELQALCVEDSELGVRDPELSGHPRGRLDHLRREVAGDQLSLIAEASSGQKAGFASSRRQLENRLARLRRELVDEPFGDRPGRFPEDRATALPAAGHALPQVVAALSVLREVGYAVHQRGSNSR